MSQVVSLYTLKDDADWKKRVVLFAHPVASDSARIFLPGDEEELVKFFREENYYRITDPEKALSVEFWSHAGAQPCGKLIEISYPKQKQGHKPKRRKARNSNRQKYSQVAPRPTLNMRPLCVGVCKVSGKSCRPCKLGHGVQGCVCG